MTEVPEYLLRRSRERREALGLAPKSGGGDAGGAAPAESAPAAAGAPAEAGAPSPAPVPAATTPAPVAVAEEVPAVVAAASKGPRSGVPFWMMPVLALLPLWAFLYIGSFGTRGGTAETPIQMGQRLFASKCATCHGATGGGGVGPKLAGGEAKLTFPNEADHIAWVDTGSGPHKGQPYGDPNRPGGQHIAASGGMPAFKGTLTDAEIQAIVTYEREGL